MRKLKDYIGLKFGRFVVLREVDRNVRNERVFECKCSCGEIRYLRSCQFKTQKSCGCYQKEIARENGKLRKRDLTGKTFGNWKVLSIVDKTDSSGNSYFLCECSCNSKKRKIVAGHSLIKGTSISCGCVRNKKASDRMIKRNRERPKEKHYLYNPNLTEEERVKRRCFRREVNAWCANVYKKDDYKCVVCGSNRNKSAHHLNSWNTYPEERFLVSNGITLCKACHLQFHKDVGFGWNTKEQFREWFKNVKSFT